MSAGNHIASTHKIGAFRPSPYATKGRLLPGEKIILPIWAANTCIPISNTRPSPKTTIAAPMQQKKRRTFPRLPSIRPARCESKLACHCGRRFHNGGPSPPVNRFGRALPIGARRFIRPMRCCARFARALAACIPLLRQAVTAPCAIVVPRWRRLLRFKPDCFSTKHCF